MTPFAEVKSTLPAERVLESYLGPARRHAWRCPFHDDKNPSMSAKDGGIRCFACGWAGDIFRFVEDHVTVDRGESLRILADMAGIVLPDRTRPDRDGPRLRLPSLARSYAGVLREIASLEAEIFHEAQKAAAMAWRTAWDVKGTEKVWDVIAIGAALDREVALLEMETACEKTA